MNDSDNYQWVDDVDNLQVRCCITGATIPYRELYFPEFRKLIEAGEPISSPKIQDILTKLYLKINS